MKKTVSKIVIMVMMCTLVVMSAMAILWSIPKVSAASYEEECDAVFRETMDDIFAKEGIMAKTVEVEKQPIFDITLTQLGYIYSMLYDQAEGYAIVVNTIGDFDVAEFYSKAENPFVGYNGQYVYISLMLTLVYQDGNFVETSTGTVLDETMIADLESVAYYSGTTSMTYTDETVYFIDRTENKFQLAFTHPKYIPSNVSNACVPATGANIIGYYDRFYPELIPNYTPGSALLHLYMYKPDSDEATDLIETLYYEMGTNATEPGTTISEFVSGMTSYVGGKNLSISFDSCMQNGDFNFAETKQQLGTGLPLALFLDTYSVMDILNGDDHDTLNGFTSSALHAMAGFGYNEITYTLAGGTIREDRYIAVATGLSNRTHGYFNVDYGTQIDECYAVNIF